MQKIQIMRGVSYCAIAYAHSIGFDTAMQVGTFNGCLLYICKFLHAKEEPRTGFPQYVIVKDKEAIPLTLEETMIILRARRKI